MFEIIDQYTRQQAIKDGVLVDLTQDYGELCQEHYKIPVACTAAVWGIVDKAVKNEKYANDYNGVLHDILWMSQQGKVREQKITIEHIIWFKCIITGAGRKKYWTFKVVCHPGDNFEPVVTIMLSDES